MGSSTGSENVSLLSEIRHGERTGRRSVLALENIKEECVKSGGRTGGKQGGSEVGGSEDVVAVAGQHRFGDDNDNDADAYAYAAVSLPGFRGIGLRRRGQSRRFHGGAIAQFICGAKAIDRFFRGRCQDQFSLVSERGHSEIVLDAFAG